MSVLTISNPQRLLSEKIYREQCAERLVEVLLDLENYLGAGQIFIP